jgi:hypothetical protein
LAWVRFLSRHLPAVGLIERATRIELSCSLEALEIQMLRRDTRNTPLLTEMLPLPNECDLSIQLHRGMLQAMVRDPVALLLGAAIANQVFTTADPPVAEIEPAAILSPPALAWRIAHSPDDQWIVLEHVRQAQPPAAISTGIPAARAIR